eukprot:TRINITY_DN9315_c0_g1_i1.p2 TRINITY_DN9315_c0_g1~~TRINITY_DN9315_c0_g1_i1.p2  ORF type:complete len:215 (+),score=40.23 TRINITY_DN9315_c0_g1_i1:665-1309(+)
MRCGLQTFRQLTFFHQLHLLRRARLCDWVVWTDMDEFHELHGKNVHETIDQLEESNYNALTGRMIDRVAEDGGFHPVMDRPSLFEQFPYECNITRRILNANRDKVLLASARLIPASGHHSVFNESVIFSNYPNYRFLIRDTLQRNDSSVRARDGGTVWHFKWIAGVERYLKDRVASFKDHKYGWWEESKNFLRYVRKHKTIDVAFFCRKSEKTK